MIALVLASWLTGWSCYVPPALQVCPCDTNCAAVVVPETTMVTLLVHTFSPGGLYTKPINLTDTLKVWQGTWPHGPGRWIAPNPGWMVLLSWVVMDAAGNKSCGVDRSTKTLLTQGPGTLK